MSVNRILANHANLVREAAIVASAQRASTDVRLMQQARNGGGRLVIGGAYTGAADTEIDVEVVSGTGGELTASAPVIAGVGNGTLTVSAIDPAAEPETLTVSLLDAGTQPEPALLEFFGATLAARTPGAGSNALALSVTRNLTTTPMQYATLAPIAAGTDRFEGPQFDWGQPPATDAGIPAAALRIQFAGFPTVHRAWKTWESGRFIYRIDPAAPYDIPENTRLLSVAGDYTLTLTDGVVTETYTAVTIYDFLSQVEARSALATVRGVVAADRAPGGMAVTDIPLRTDAHALPPTGGRVEIVSVAPSAATENITLTHLGTAGGGRTWSVEGGVSGTLPNATTGVLYTHGPVSFRVPDADPAAAAGGRISAVVQLTTREDGEGIPSICFKPLALGAAASDKTVTFTYRVRPPADCYCNDMPALKLSAKCLGLDIGGGQMALDAEYQTRLEALYAWRAEFIGGNVGVQALNATTFGATDFLAADERDIELAQGATAKFAEALAEIYESGAALDQWDTYFAALQSALSVYADLEPRNGAHRPAPAGVWLASYRRETGSRIRPTASGGFLVKVVRAGQSGSSEPDWSDYAAGDLIADGDAVLQRLPSYWEAEAEVAPGTEIDAGYGVLYRTEGGGTTGTVEPAWPTDSDLPFTDGTVSWEMVAPASAQVHVGGDLSLDTTQESDPLIVVRGAGAKSVGSGGTAARDAAKWLADTRARTAGSVDLFVDKCAALMDHCRTIAGIVPKSSAGSDAGECWRDYPDETHWWVDESGEYLPAFTNRPYVSASLDADGKIHSTREFGFGIVTPCAHRLKEGDQFRITIRGTGTVAAREGTKIVIPVIAAASAPFIGGSDGDPTQTWTVRGTVSGALPDWLYNPAAPAPYTHGPATLELAQGGIPWEVGDRISVSLEGGTLRWRRDGGAWTSGNLYGVTHALGDGLTLAAEPGAAPSFVAGDAWRYRAIATHGVSRLRRPRIGQAFAWDGAAVTLDVDLGSVRPLEAVLLALHTLPSGCTVTISGGEAAVGEWSVVPAWHPSAVLAVLPAGTTARYMRVAVTGAGAGAALGWLWAGKGWQPTVGASDLTLRRQYGLSRGQGINPAALYRGRGMGGAWRWDIAQGGALVGDNADELLALIDHTAEQGMEPVCIVPDIRDPARAAVAIIDADEVVMTESNSWQSSKKLEPQVSVELPFRAVLA
jgi:hypothetical protein